VGNPFLETTTVTRVDDGSYRGVVDEAWNLRPLPQGGIVTAMAVRAMATELDDPVQRLRTLHTTFVAQVTDGPVSIDVEMLRRGRSVSHLRAEVRNDGAARGHVTTAVFGAPREGFDLVDARPPVVPPPEDCPSFRDPPPPDVEMFEPMPFWDQVVDGRPALGHPPWEDYEPQTSERALWCRFDDTPWLDDGTVDPLAVVVVADTMPGAVSEALGPAAMSRPWFGPSVDLTVHVLDDCRSEWILGHNRARHASDGYGSVEMALWDMGGDPRLIAYATQVMFFAFLD
jgi:acyl-CoA thioesterase